MTWTTFRYFVIPSAVREKMKRFFFARNRRLQQNLFHFRYFFFLSFCKSWQELKFHFPLTPSPTHARFFTLNQICLTFICYVHGSLPLNIITEVYLDGSTNTQRGKNSLTFTRIDGRNSRKKWLSETLTAKTCHKHKAAHVYKIWPQQ
jgi:hypothetical protein